AQQLTDESDNLLHNIGGIRL
ncbi:hypothetical protein EVA_05736, partial [gut metagenome]